MEDIEYINEGDNIIRMPDLNYEPNPNGIGYEFFVHMKKHKNAISQIDVSSGNRDTFSTLLERCIRTAIQMKARGVVPNDIICLCSYNHLNSCVPHIASYFVGAIVAALDATISFNDTKYLLDQIKPKMIFVVPESEKDIDDAIRDLSLKAEIVVFGETAEHTSFSEFLESLDDEEENFMPFIVDDMSDTSTIFFSSGTTGLPKGICVNHSTLLSQTVNFTWSGFESNVGLNFASLYWISAALFLFQSILAGTTRLIVPKFDAFKVWDYISTYEVTLMFLAPSHAIAMLKVGRPDSINTTNLLDIMVGGGPISSEMLLAFRDLLPGTNVSQSYGQTEVAGLITVFKPKIRSDVLALHNKPGSCGRPVNGLWYKIVDLETEETVGPNQSGELRIRTKFQMNGYYNLDSSSAWDSDGWLKTGDVVYYDEDHCFYIVDRIKEMLKFQSWHVPPALLEGVLQQHSAVKMAVVIGLPHEEDGDHPLGLVVLSEGFDNLTPEDLEKFVAERVDDRQRLRGGVKFISEDDIPFTPTGKIQRNALRNKILSRI